MDNALKLADELKIRARDADNPRSVLKAPELKDLYKKLKQAPPEEKPALGKILNELKQELISIALEKNNRLTHKTYVQSM